MSFRRRFATTSPISLWGRLSSAIEHPRERATSLELRGLQPLGILRRAVEALGRLELLEAPASSSLGGAGEQRLALLRAERLEGESHAQGLLEHAHRVAAGDDHRGWR